MKNKIVVILKNVFYPKVMWMNQAALLLLSIVASHSCTITTLFSKLNHILKPAGFKNLTDVINIFRLTFVLFNAAIIFAATSNNDTLLTHISFFKSNYYSCHNYHNYYNPVKG